MTCDLTHIRCGAASTRETVNYIRLQSFQYVILKRKNVDESLLDYRKPNLVQDVEKQGGDKDGYFGADLQRVGTSKKQTEIEEWSPQLELIGSATKLAKRTP